MWPAGDGEAGELSEPTWLWPKHTMRLQQSEGMSGIRSRNARRVSLGW